MGLRILTNRVTDHTGDADDLGALYAPPTTPWLRVNMVSTVDGAATGADGRSGSINNEADGLVFHLLRELADVIVVGAGTARAEGYRPAGKPIALVSRSGEVPASLGTASNGMVLMVTTETAAGSARERLGAENVLALGRDLVELAMLKPALAERGLTNLLCEGGPHLLTTLLAAGAVDELCSTTVPRLVGGLHRRITEGPGLDAPMELMLLLEDHGTLIARWFAQRV
jgi:riboflavin biosynthesis pyrimidine reductase